MSENCANCRFFHVKTDTAVFKEADGFCRRNAPVGPAIAGGYAWSVFPPMFSGQWCGDHRPASDAAPVRKAAAA